MARINRNNYKVLFSLLTIIFILNCSGTRPHFVAEGHNKLAPCPETPNCVSTLSTDEEHKIEPFTFTTSNKAAMRVLKDAVRSMKRAEIVAETENYLYIEFTSVFWQFVHDVEFSLDMGNKVFHFRSASRVGKSDFGKNRTRMEEIRKRFYERLKQEQETTQ